MMTNAAKSGVFLLGGDLSIRRLVFGAMRVTGQNIWGYPPNLKDLYNISHRNSESVLQYCEKKQLGFIPWYPLGSGDLVEPGGKLERVAKAKGVPPVQIALAWLLKHSPVMLPIPGTSSVKHLEENIDSVAIELTDEELSQLA